MNDFEVTYFTYIAFPCGIIGIIFGIIYFISSIRNEWKKKDVENFEIFTNMLAPLPAFFLGIIFGYILPIVLLFGIPTLIIKYLRKITT